MMNIEIIKYVIILVLGAVIVYLKKYTNVIQKVNEVIVEAENVYSEYENAGAKKMQFCISKLNEIIPKVLKPILTDEILEILIQSIFNEVSKYAEIQKQKLAEQINNKLAN